MKPTNKLRWHREKYYSSMTAHYYESTEQVPVQTLQQWWQDGDELDSPGEWRDVPVEGEGVE